VPESETPGGTRPGATSRGIPRSLAGRGRTNRSVGRETPAKPGSTEGLGGRTATRPDRGETLKSARAALRRSLGGRPAEPADFDNPRHSLSKEEQRRLDRRRRDEEAAAPYGGIVGGYELFDLDDERRGVLEPAKQSGPVKRSGPALGAGRAG